MLIRNNKKVKLPKSFLERVQSKTKADSELKLMLLNLAPNFANALVSGWSDLSGV
jgi:hypothetical protein